MMILEEKKERGRWGEGKRGMSCGGYGVISP
jgi:hypothetical protein